MKTNKTTDEQKSELSLHTDPVLISASHLAILMSLLSDAFELGKKLNVSFPIHVSVKINDIDACGSIKPNNK